MEILLPRAALLTTISRVCVCTEFGWPGRMCENVYPSAGVAAAAVSVTLIRFGFVTKSALRKSKQRSSSPPSRGGLSSKETQVAADAAAAAAESQCITNHPLLKFCAMVWFLYSREDFL